MIYLVMVMHNHECRIMKGKSVKFCLEELCDIYVTCEQYKSFDTLDGALQMVKEVLQ